VKTEKLDDGLDRETGTKGSVVNPLRYSYGTAAQRG
jgi:hypothetical protein